MNDPRYNPGPHPELPDGCLYDEADGDSSLSSDGEEEEG